MRVLGFPNRALEDVPLVPPHELQCRGVGLVLRAPVWPSAEGNDTLTDQSGIAAEVLRDYYTQAVVHGNGASVKGHMMERAERQPVPDLIGPTTRAPNEPVMLA